MIYIFIHRKLNPTKNDSYLLSFERVNFSYSLPKTMLYWILSVICIVTLHSCVASKYYYKEDNGNYDVYYGPYPRWGYKEFRPPKSYKLTYEDRGNRPGKCIRGEFICDSPYPIAKTKFFECEIDYQCPRFFKCCQNHCFQHKICQPIDLEACDDNNEVPTDTPVIKTTSEVVTTQSSDSTVRSNSGSTQISTTTQFPTTLNGITTKEIVSTTATVTIEDHPSSTTFPYTTTSKTTKQSTSCSTQTPTTKRKEPTTSKLLTSTAFHSTQQISKSTTITTNKDWQSTSIISTENSKTVDYHSPSSYTTTSESSTFQSSTTKIFETTTEIYLPLNISSTGAEETEIPKEISTRHTLKPTTVVKNENSTLTTSTVTESPSSIITKLSPTKTTEITIVPSSPTTAEDNETITRKEISTQYTLKPTTVRENEHTRSTSVTSTKFDKITGENGKDTGTTKKASSTVSSDQNGQEMFSDYTTSYKVLTTSQIPEMKTTKGKTTVTSNISVSTFATQFPDNSTRKYSNPTTFMSSQTTSVKYGITEPTTESVILQKTTTPETTTVVKISSSITSRPPQNRTNPTTKFITQTTKLLDTSPVSITYKPTLQPESTTTAQKTSKANGPAIPSVVTIPDSTYKSTSNGTKSSTVEPFSNTTATTLDVTSSKLPSTSKATSMQMTQKSAVDTTTPLTTHHESTSKRVTELSEADDEDFDFSGSGDNLDDILIQEKFTTASRTDDFTFSNEPSSRQEIPQSFIKSTHGREETKGKEFYDINSTIGTIISEATRISTQSISHSTLSTLSTAVKDSPKLPDNHITIALEESSSSTVTIPEKLRTVTSKLDNSMNSGETSTKMSGGTSSERISTTHDYFNTTLELKTTSPKSTTKVTQQPTSKSTDAENNSITSINTLLSSGSTPRTTHVKDVESTTNGRTVTTFPISEYPYGNKIYMMDRLLGTFRKLPSVHDKAGDGGDNYHFNNFLGFLDKISDLLMKRNDTVYNNLDNQTTTLSERSTSYKSGQGTTQAATKDNLTVDTLFINNRLSYQNTRNL